MENGDPKEEPLKEKSLKKMRDRNNKQATVLKQLNNQNLYPLQERIGIYVVAALSALGLILITYTGVMALVSNAEDGVYAPNDADVNVDEMYGMLEDLEGLEELISSNDYESDGTGQEAGNSTQNVESDGNEDDEEPDEDIAIGIINADNVHLLREPGSDDALLALQEGYEVRLLNLEHDVYWAQVEIETDAIDGISALQGFIERRFIDVEE